MQNLITNANTKFKESWIKEVGDDFYKEVKIKAISEGKTLKAYVVGLLKADLKNGKIK